MILFSKIC